MLAGPKQDQHRVCSSPSLPIKKETFLSGLVNSFHTTHDTKRHSPQCGAGILRRPNRSLSSPMRSSPNGARPYARCCVIGSSHRRDEMTTECISEGSHGVDRTCKSGEDEEQHLDQGVWHLSLLSFLFLSTSLRVQASHSIVSHL